MIIPLPKGFDASQHAEGETFDITATVRLTPEGLAVEAVDGAPVEADEPPAETEIDEEALKHAMGRSPTPEAMA